MFGLLSGVGSVLGGLGSLFGRKKSPDARANMVLQAQGARQAAEKYGFNPLTMLQYGQPGGAMGGGGGTPPLASVQMIVDGLKGIDDVTSGDAERRRAADQLELDLAQLKLDQARSGVIAVAPQYAVNGVGSGPSPLGVRPVRVQQSVGGPRGRYGYEGSSVLHPGVDDIRGLYGAGGDRLRPLEEVDPTDPRRGVDNAPVKTTGGFMVVDNPHLDGPVRVPTADGDEALQWYDWPTIGLAWAGTRLWENQKATLGPAEDDQPRLDAERRKRWGKERMEEYPPSYYERFRYNYPAFRP